MGFGAGLASLAATGGQVMAGYKQALHQDNVNNYIDQTHDYDLNQQAAKNSLLPIETQNQMLGAQLQGLDTQTKIDLQPITDQTAQNTALTNLSASQGGLTQQPYVNQANLSKVQTGAVAAGTGLEQAGGQQQMQRLKDAGQTYYLMSQGNLSGAIDYANSAGIFGNQKVANIQASMLPLAGPDGKAVPTKVYRFLGPDGNPITDASGKPAVYTDATLQRLAFMANPPSLQAVKADEKLVGFSPATGAFTVADNPVNQFKFDRYGSNIINGANGGTLPVAGGQAGSAFYTNPGNKARFDEGGRYLQGQYAGTMKGNMWIPDPSNAAEYGRAQLYLERLLMTNPNLPATQAAARAQAMAHQDIASGKVSGAGVGGLIGGNQSFGLGSYPAPGQTASPQPAGAGVPFNGQPKYPWQ